MDNKRKRSFFDDRDDQIRKMQKTSNATIGKYSIGTRQRFRYSVTNFFIAQLM